MLKQDNFDLIIVLVISLSGRQLMSHALCHRPSACFEHGGRDAFFLRFLASNGSIS